MQPILYLAQAYSIYPDLKADDVLIHQAFRNACIWSDKLLTLGFEVFSPILHTHAFHYAMGSVDGRPEERTILYRRAIITQIHDAGEALIFFLRGELIC